MRSRSTSVVSILYSMILCLLPALNIYAAPLPFKSDFPHQRTFNNPKDPYLRINEVNTFALRDFYNKFPTITDNKWLKLENGFLTKFNCQGIRNQVFYDTRGIFILYTRYYEEKNMPGEIKYLVHKRYPGYRINVASECVTGTESFFEVSIKNKKYVKKLKISNADIEETEVFRNGDPFEG